MTHRLLLLLLLLGLSATLAFGQSRAISLDFDEVPIKTIFYEIEQQCNSRFFYSENIIDTHKTYTIHVKNAPIDEVIKLLFNDQQVSYKMLDNKLIVLMPIEKVVKPILVSGKIRAVADNQILEGVRVAVKGTNYGTSTDKQGNFMLEVPYDNSVLLISCIGYLTMDVPVDQRSFINVSMLEDIANLDEIVVIGFGTQKRLDVTGAISSMNADEFLKNPITSIESGIQGRMPGVLVTSSSGKPGAVSNIQVRGVNTLGNTDPLYVIDGLPIYNDNNGLNSGNSGITNIMSTLNSVDIEKIEVLKDAASCAIYGSRATNGVVIITTKKGRAGAPQLKVNMYTGTQSVTKELSLTDKWEHSVYLRTFYVNSLRIPPYFAIYPQYFPNINWQSELYKTGATKNVDFTFSGGNESANISITGAYNTTNGIVVNTNLDRYNLRVNSEYKNKRFTVTENVAISNLTDKPGYGNDIVRLICYASPAMYVYDKRQNSGYGVPTYLTSTNNPTPNPLAIQKLYNANNLKNRLLGSLMGQYNILDNFNYKLTLGLDYLESDNRLFIPTFDMGISSLTNPDKAQLTVGKDNARMLTSENRLEYQLKSDKHDFSLMGAAVTQNYTQSNTTIVVRDFLSNNQQSINNALEKENILGNSSSWSILSYLSRLNYTFNRKYFVSFIVRFDGTSRFVGANKWGAFPAFSAGWLISDEKFMKQFKPLQYCKLRFSWGQTGNQEVSFYSTRNYINNHANYILGSGNQGAVVSGMTYTWPSNANLKWERTSQINSGIDIGLFSNAVFFSIDNYYKLTTDLIIQKPIPAYSGYTYQPFENAGTVENKGWEFAVTYKKYFKSLYLSVAGNFATINNKVLSVTNDASIIGEQGITRTSKGYPIGAFYGWKFDGIFQSNKEIREFNAIDGNPATQFQPNAKYGDVRFKDIDGDGKITDNDRTYLGSAIPNYIYGLTIDAKLSIFDISLLFQGVSGNKIYNMLRRGLESTNGAEGFTNKLKTVKNAWVGGSDNSKIAKVSYTDFNDNNRVSDRWIEDGSFFRFKSLSVGVSLPEKVLSKLKGIKGLRLYINVTNLFTYTVYSGYDPEIGNESQVLNNGKPSLLMGVDQGVYPQTEVS